MKKNKKLPSIVILLILTLITALFWLSFSVYSVFSKPSKTVVPEEQLQDINPRLDSNVIEQMKSRVYF